MRQVIRHVRAQGLDERGIAIGSGERRHRVSGRRSVRAGRRHDDRVADLGMPQQDTFRLGRIE